MENKELEKKNATMELEEDALTGVTGGGNEEYCTGGGSMGINTSDKIDDDGGTSQPCP